MASTSTTSHCAFSHDQRYLALCGTDGKLKIWETATGRFKQEFVPNLHLSSPCSVLGWIVVGIAQPAVDPPQGTQWKKRRKKSINTSIEDAEHKEVVALGSTNGTITLYDVSASSICGELSNCHSSTITALTWSPEAGLISAGEDKQLAQWALQDGAVRHKWKSGKGRVTALVALPGGESLLAGERKIKWWCLARRELLATFGGCASQVALMRCVKLGAETSYLFSAASGESCVSVWSLSETKKEVLPVATLTLPDEALTLALRSSSHSNSPESSSSSSSSPHQQLHVLTVTRSGHAQLFQYQANGACARPLKPSLDVLVAAAESSAANPPKESVQQIAILAGELTERAELLLAYGSPQGLSVERVKPDFGDKVQCLVRADPRRTATTRERKQELPKCRDDVADEDEVQYLTPGSGEAGTSVVKRAKSGSGSELPLKIRLDNLSLSAEASQPNKATAKGENMTQLLIQALHSEDKNLLATVLYTKKESVIKNTVAKLPAQAIIPLLKELTSMLHGKTYPCKFAVMWLKALVTAQMAQMINQPNIADALAPILSLIDEKQALLPDIIKMHGRVALITDQISEKTQKEEKDITEDCLLVYQDQDSSDEDIDLTKLDMEDESDDNWEETSDQEPMQEEVENGKSDDGSSVCDSD